MMNWLRSMRARVWRLPILAAACLFAGSALAASPAQTAKPAAAPAAKPKPLTGYARSVVDEVDMQNLTCDDLRIFLTKPLEASLLQAAEEVLDRPQNLDETSLTLFGPRLNNLILTSSGAGPPCRKVVSVHNVGFQFDPSVCYGDGLVSPIADRSMAMLSEIPFHRPGELQILGEFQTAAKLRNCRI